MADEAREGQDEEYGGGGGLFGGKITPGIYSLIVHYYYNKIYYLFIRLFIAFFFAGGGGVHLFVFLSSFRVPITPANQLRIYLGGSGLKACLFEWLDVHTD